MCLNFIPAGHSAISTVNKGRKIYPDLSVVGHRSTSKARSLLFPVDEVKLSEEIFLSPLKYAWIDVAHTETKYKLL
jgi:hypothetical protein